MGLLIGASNLEIRERIDRAPSSLLGLLFLSESSGFEHVESEEAAQVVRLITAEALEMADHCLSMMEEALEDADSVEPVEPADSVEPVEPADSVEPVEPADSVEPVEPAE
jgi:hypothetical protein